MTTKYSVYDEQFEIAAELIKFAHDDRRGIVLNAPAGTGKTYTLNVVSNILKELFDIEITMIAYTGRAASQLRKSGSPNVSTSHRLLYTPILDKEGNLEGWANESHQDLLEKTGDIIVIDEGSMLPKGIYDDILSIGKKIIITGDDEQLEPVDDSSTFNPMTDTEFTTFSLKTNRRTDVDAEGIYFISNHLRENNTIPKRKMKGLGFKPKATTRFVDFYRDNKYDAVLCGTNKTRIYLNMLIRKANGFNSDIPQPGERVMCLKNSVTPRGEISNGELFEVIRVNEGPRMSDFNMRNIDTDVIFDIRVHNDWWMERDPPSLSKEEKKSTHRFCFGYALTVFKAQGSTFDRVLYIDEDVSFFANQKKFRYTGVSRAAKHLDISL